MVGGEAQRGLLDHHERGRADGRTDGSGERDPAARLLGAGYGVGAGRGARCRAHPAHWLASGDGQEAAPSPPSLSPEWMEQRAPSAGASAGGCRSCGHRLAELPGRSRRPRPVSGGPTGPWHGHRGVWHPRSPSSWLWLPASLPPPAKVRDRGGPGVTGQCWGGPAGSLGLFGGVRRACWLCWAWLLPSPRGVRLRVPACLSLLIVEYRRLNFGAGQEGCMSAAMPAASPARLPLQGLCCSAQGWLQRGRGGHGHQPSHSHPRHRSWWWRGAVPARQRGQGRVDQGCGEPEGPLGRKLVMRERAGKF